MFCIHFRLVKTKDIKNLFLERYLPVKVGNSIQNSTHFCTFATLFNAHQILDFFALEWYVGGEKQYFINQTLNEN